MSTPEDIVDAGKPRRRSRLFQAAPNRLLVDEWVPNIKLPPPPTTELEDDGPSAMLDEHGLPVREPEEEEPETEHRGPARIYVGQGAPTVGAANAPVVPELQSPELPDLRLPRGASGSSPEDDEEDSSGDLPDISIDGSGGGWEGLNVGRVRQDEPDLEAPTDPNLRARAEAKEPPAIAMPAAEEKPVPAVPARPTSTSRTTPSWTRPAPSADRATRRPPEAPPQIRAAAPPRPEPSLASFVPRSLIIAIVVLGAVALAVWAVHYAGLTDPAHEVAPPSTSAPATEITTVDGLVIQPAEPRAEHAPKPVPEAQPAAPSPEPAVTPEAAPTPRPQPVAPEAAPTPRPQPVAPEAAPTPRPQPSASASKPAAPKPPPVAAPKPAPEAAPKPAPEAAPKPQPTTPEAAPAPKPVPAAAPPAAMPGGKGFMVVESDRYAMIYMGGRRLGGTPVARMELEPGTYAIRAVCRDTGASQTKQVEIQSGELSTTSFKFLP